MNKTIYYYWLKRYWKTNVTWPQLWALSPTCMWLHSFPGVMTRAAATIEVWSVRIDTSRFTQFIKYYRIEPHIKSLLLFIQNRLHDDGPNVWCGFIFYAQDVIMASKGTVWQATQSTWVQLYPKNPKLTIQHSVKWQPCGKETGETCQSSVTKLHWNGICSKLIYPWACHHSNTISVWDWNLFVQDASRAAQLLYYKPFTLK